MNQLDGGSTQMPGGDACCDAWMSSPSHFGSLLVESTQMLVKPQEFNFNLSLHGTIDVMEIKS